MRWSGCQTSFSTQRARNGENFSGANGFFLPAKMPYVDLRSSSPRIQAPAHVSFTTISQNTPTSATNAGIPSITQ